MLRLRLRGPVLTPCPYPALAAPEEGAPHPHSTDARYTLRPVVPGCPLGGLPPASPPPGPPAPQTKVTIVGKKEICNGEDLVGPFLVHILLGPRPPPSSLLTRMGERTARDLGRVAPQRIPRRMEAQVLPSRRDTLGGAGGVRALDICIQLYIDELSPANPLIPSIALASRT